MSKSVRFAMGAIVLLSMSAATAAEPAGVATPKQSWQRAMDLSDQKRYDEALGVLRSAMERYPDDTDLRWLEAGVLGWSGRHDESVELYEQLVADHPELADNVRVDLATQRLWSGDPEGALEDFERRLEENPSDYRARTMRAMALAHADRLRESLDAYDELLADNPNDPDLRVGRATVLSWMGKHTRATGAYESVLDDDPDNAAARIGLAENENWRGNHGKAAAMFEELRESDPHDPDVLKGIAYANYWDERPEEARRALDEFIALEPGDQEGINLDRLLLLEDHQTITGGFAASDDSDDLRIETLTLDYRLPLPRRMAVSVLVRRDNVRDPGGSRDLLRIGAGFEKRWSDRWKAEASVSHFDSGNDHGTRGLVDGSATFRPGDRLAFEAGIEQEPVLTRLSQDLDIRTTNVYAGAEWKALDRLMVEGAVEAKDYSDGNDSMLVTTNAEWEFLSHRRNRFAATFGVDYLTTDLDLDNGYYDPDSYSEYGPGVEWEWESVKNVTFGVKARTGYQKEKGVEGDSFYQLVGVAEFPLGRMFRLDLLVERTDSSLSAASGFEQTRGAVYLTRAF